MVGRRSFMRGLLGAGVAPVLVPPAALWTPPERSEALEVIPALPPAPEPTEALQGGLRSFGRPDAGKALLILPQFGREGGVAAVGGEIQLIKFNRIYDRVMGWVSTEGMPTISYGELRVELHMVPNYREVWAHDEAEALALMLGGLE